MPQNPPPHLRRGDFAADRRLVVLASLAVPIAAACTGVAWLLVRMITFATNVFYYGEASFVPRAPSAAHWGAWSVLVPVVGGLIIGAMARFGSDRIRGHGIPEALEVILFGKSLMKPKVALLKPLSAAISIGSGGPFGAEGPIIMTGGAFGSLIAQIFRLSAAERKTLLVAGAAAGMTAIFGTPLAAVLLALEILLFEMRPRSLVPVAIAAAVAMALRPALFEVGPLFPLAELGPLPASASLWAVLVGLVAGVVAWGVNAWLYWLEDSFHRLPIHWMWWPALAGVAVGAVGAFQPRILGVGYDVIGEFLQNRMGFAEAAPLVLAKSVAWGIALGSGTSGGVLAPMLIMGSGLGVLEASVLPFGALWPVVSMAAVMGGLMRAPLTAVAFAFEVTHASGAIAPALCATAVAYGVTVLVMKRSILTEKVARRGHDIFYEYAVDPLERVRVGDVMSRPAVTIPATMSITECQETYFARGQRHRGYPVLDAESRLLGVLTAHDFLSLPSDTAPADREAWRAGDLVQREALTIAADAPCRAAAEAMATHGVGRLVVVDAQKGQVLGMVTRSDLLKPRRSAVQEETERTRHLALRSRESKPGTA